MNKQQEMLFAIPGYPNYFADPSGDIWSTQPRGKQKNSGFPKKLSKFVIGEYRQKIVVKLTLPNGKKVHRTVVELNRLAFPEG